MNIIPITNWKNYYKRLLIEDKQEFIIDEIVAENGDSSYEVEEDILVDEEILVEPNDISEAVRSMKNRKAPGLRSINIELLKAATHILIGVLEVNKIFNKCLHGCYLFYM